MIAALIIILPEYKLPTLVSRALLDTDGTCDALSKTMAKEIGSVKSNGSWGSNDPQQRDATYSDNLRLA